MKKNILYLVVFILLLAVAGWLMSESNGSTTLAGADNYAFGISDTANIDKIVISDKRPNKATVKRTEKGWILNNEYPVRKDAIEVLLETLARMEMKNFIPQRMVPEVRKDFSVYGKKVEIYKNGRLSRVFYVGLNTPNEMGTYMMLEGADQPYAVHIPGFNGFLGSRFITESYLWRSRDLVRINASSIKEVELIYSDSIEASFRLNVFSPDSINLFSAVNNERIEDFSQLKGKIFLAACANLKYEGEIIPSDPIYARRDSLLNSTPMLTIKVKDIDGNEVTVSGYRIKAAPETIDLNDPKSFFDPDRLHGFINNERMVLLQYFGLKKVLLSKAEFGLNP